MIKRIIASLFKNQKVKKALTNLFFDQIIRDESLATVCVRENVYFIEKFEPAMKMVERISKETGIPIN